MPKMKGKKMMGGTKRMVKGAPPKKGMRTTRMKKSGKK